MGIAVDPIGDPKLAALICLSVRTPLGCFDSLFAFHQLVTGSHFHHDWKWGIAVYLVKLQWLFEFENPTYGRLMLRENLK